MSFTMREETSEKIKLIEDLIKDILTEARVLLKEIQGYEPSRNKIINGSGKINKLSNIITEELKNGNPRNRH